MVADGNPVGSGQRVEGRPWSVATSYTVTSGNLNNITVYGLASQTQASGWKDYSTVAGPITG